MSSVWTALNAPWNYGINLGENIANTVVNAGIDRWDGIAPVSSIITAPITTGPSVPVGSPWDLSVESTDSFNTLSNLVNSQIAGVDTTDIAKNNIEAYIVIGVALFLLIEIGPSLVKKLL